MDIIGRGFMAQNLRAHGAFHPGTVVLATGVATTTVTSSEAYERDARTLYDTVRRCRRSGETLVYLSTASPAMYGAPDCSTEEDAPIFPPLPYGRHKLAMEAVVARSGISHLTLRMTNLVGHAQREHQLLPSLIEQVRSGHVRLHRGARRDLFDVLHAVEVMDILLRNGVRDTVVNVGSGWPAPVTRIVDRIEARLGLTAVRDTYVHPDRLTSPPVSIARLTGLIPDLRQRFGLGPTYFETVIDRYVDALLAA